MIHSLSAHQIRLLRIHAQGLSGTGLETKPSQVAKKICGMQAQDLPAARLSIRARSKEITAAHVVQARQIQRSLAWTWCMRGTLHLVAAEDAKWLVPFLGPATI
jgi:cellobiose-specific phosphotransferase system component IIA